MPIRFLNVPGSDNLRTSRPAGYKFPVGLSATGPVAGGLFAASQGAAIVSGSWYAAAQTVAMIGMSPTP